MPLTPLQSVQQIQEDADTFHALVGALVGAWNVIYHNAEAVSHTGDTVETTLRDITIPAGSMDVNGLIRVTNLWSYTNSANIKRPRSYFGGTGGTKFSDSAQTTTAFLREQFVIANRNAVNSQVGHSAGFTSSFGTGTGALVIAAIDTSVDVHLLVRGLLADGTETITSEETLVELLKMGA